MKIGLSTLATAAFCLAPLMSVAETYELTVWSDLEAPTVVDAHDEGYSVGDLLLRNGPLLDGPNGNQIGEYFSQATVVYHDDEEGRSVRNYVVEMLLEDGSIYAMDLLEFDHNVPLREQRIHHGAVVGGTGAYAGIRGSYVLRGVQQREGSSTEYPDVVVEKVFTYTLPDG